MTMDKQERVEELMTELKGISVKDYGDFKRKATLYINRFAQDLPDLPKETLLKLYKLKENIQFKIVDDIEATRGATLQTLKNLKL